MEYSKRSVPCRWEALLVVMDQQPFTDLREILREFDDSRIWVYADWVRTRRHQPETRRKQPNGYRQLTWGVTSLEATCSFHAHVNLPPHYSVRQLKFSSC